jgi:hypothetical protein
LRRTDDENGDRAVAAVFRFLSLSTWRKLVSCIVRPNLEVDVETADPTSTAAPTTEHKVDCSDGAPEQRSKWRSCIAVDPLAANMPAISPEDFKEMVADISEHGIRNEITIFRDADRNESVLHGCTRLDAAEAAGLPIIKEGALDFDVVPHRYVEGNTDRKAYIRA